MEVQPFFERIKALRSEKVESKFDDVSERDTQIIQERKLFDDVIRSMLYACPVALK